MVERLCPQLAQISSLLSQAASSVRDGHRAPVAELVEGRVAAARLQAVLREGGLETIVLRQAFSLLHQRETITAS